jgi:hypothetical protein
MHFTFCWRSKQAGKSARCSNEAGALCILKKCKAIRLFSGIEAGVPASTIAQCLNRAGKETDITALRRSG